MPELTPRQVRERAAYEAEKASKTEPKKVTARETAADRRNFFRKQAGWPLLKVE